MVGEQDLNVYLSKFDKKYWLTYKVLDILQKVPFLTCHELFPHVLPSFLHYQQCLQILELILGAFICRSPNHAGVVRYIALTFPACCL